MLGRMREGTLALETALAPAEAAGDLATVTIVLNNLGAAYADLGELTLATMYTDRSLEMAERMANPSQIAHQLERRGTCAFYAGEWGKARSYYERAVTFVRRFGQARVSLYPLLDLGRLDAAEGRRREAVQHFDEALALAEQTDDLQALCSVQSVLAEFDLLEDAPARARARLEPLLARSDERQLFRLRFLPRLAWARAVLGDEGSAQVLMERCLTWAWAEQMRLVLVDALRIQAILLQRQRRWEGAERALDETLALCRALPYPYAEAKALYVAGHLHAAKGDPDAARARYEAALAILHRLGERLYAERTELALSELG
jgi:tetratricopeptide (TPR) repeat protein